MPDKPERYSKLQLLTMQMRERIAKSAIYFFSHMVNEDVCRVIGKTRGINTFRSLTGRDFIEYLTITNALAEAERYQQRIRELLDRLVVAGVLVEMEHSEDPYLGKTYCFIRE